MPVCRERGKEVSEHSIKCMHMLCFEWHLQGVRWVWGVNQLCESWMAICSSLHTSCDAHLTANLSNQLWAETLNLHSEYQEHWDPEHRFNPNTAQIWNAQALCLWCQVTSGLGFRTSGLCCTYICFSDTVSRHCNMHYRCQWWIRLFISFWLNLSITNHFLGKWHSALLKIPTSISGERHILRPLLETLLWFFHAVVFP